MQDIQTTSSTRFYKPKVKKKKERKKERKSNRITETNFITKWNKINSTYAHQGSY